MARARLSAAAEPFSSGAGAWANAAEAKSSRTAIAVQRHRETQLFFPAINAAPYVSRLPADILPLARPAGKGVDMQGVRLFAFPCQRIASARVTITRSPMVDATELNGETRFSVRVQPRARRTAIEGVRDGALLVRLTAPPVEG